jgi:O-antigen/teichoic acid export membrane protein
LLQQLSTPPTDPPPPAPPATASTLRAEKLPIRHGFQKLLRSESSWQLLDQAVVSAGNFLTTLLLARTLVPELYGTFSLIYLALYAINTCHASLVLYPLTLNAATAERHTVGATAGQGALRTLLLAPVEVLALLATAAFVHRLDLLPLLALSMFAWQLQETMRRGLLASRRPLAAVLPDALSYLGQAAIIFLVHARSLETIFLIIVLTSSAAAVLQAISLRVSLATAFQREHIAYAWQLGRFALTGNLLTMILLQVPSWALVIFAGRAAVGSYQSLGNLINVMNPVTFSLSSLLIPTIARASLESTAAAWAAMYKHGLRFGVLLLPAFLAYLLVPASCMSVIYGHASPYLRFAPLMRILAPTIVFDYLSTVIGAFEGGNGRPRTFMQVQLLAVSTLLLCGVFLIRSFGVRGAVLSVLFISVARFVAFLLLSHHYQVRARSIPLVTPLSRPEEPA